MTVFPLQFSLSSLFSFFWGVVWTDPFLGTHGTCVSHPLTGRHSLLSPRGSSTYNRSDRVRSNWEQEPRYMRPSVTTVGPYADTHNL